MTANIYPQALKLVLEHEGGNDDDPRDPGGRTSRGILQREWNNWRASHPGSLPADVWQAPQDQVDAIYRQKYWDAMHCDDLPAGVDYCAFDYGVNSGIGRAARVLKEFSSVTDPRNLITSICDERIAFLQRLGTWSTFGRGWTRRVAEVRAASLKMAAIEVIAEPLPTPQPVAPTQAPLLYRVIASMEAKGYRIDKGLGEINIAYAEGHDRDGTRNDNKPGYWNDVRMVFTYVVGLPALKGAWTATTQPGPYYTENRLNPLGAANIKPGQYTAWRVGLHRGQYEALVQRGTITLTRDDNEDYSRVGDKEETGDYEGVNQHHGSNAETVGPHSAGCLVAKMVDGHEEFMGVCKSDPRYKADHNFMFTTTILTSQDI